MPAQDYRRSPVTLILAGAVCISFSGIWVNLSGVAPTLSAFYRVFFGSLFLAIACLLRDEFQRPSLKTTLLSVLCGLCFAVNLSCWHASIIFIGPGLATIISNFQVFVLALVSLVVFGEKIRPIFFVSLPLAFFGLFQIIGFDWSSLPENYRTGVYLGLATALLYSAFLLVLRKIQQVQQSLSFFFSLLLVSLSASFFLGTATWWTGGSFRVSGLVPLGSLLCLGLFSQTIGWSLIANSLPRVSPAVTGLVLLLQPALAFIWDVVFFARPTSADQWLGVGVTLAAIYLGMTAARAPATKPAAVQRSHGTRVLAKSGQESYSNDKGSTEGKNGHQQERL
jgi:drug/metabolite transporter (DMT)-like permease